MNKDLAKSIGTGARAARKALRLTQEDTAERIDVSVEFYARIERGTSLPSIETFARIVSVLGVSADVLLGRPVATPVANVSWAPQPPTDSPEMRRLNRRLRKAQPSTIRLVNLLLKELERREAGEVGDLEPGSSDGENPGVMPAGAAANDDDEDGAHFSVRHLDRSAEPVRLLALAE